MARTHNNKEIDFDKLKMEFAMRGINASKASKCIGRSSGYFSNMKGSGYLPEATLILLDAKFGIEYEDIKPSEVVPTTEVQIEFEKSAAPITLTKEELRYIITESIKDAFMWYANR